ncbi:MAG: hypothetical protein ACM3IG_11505 [Myxococcales bacterium]
MSDTKLRMVEVILHWAWDPIGVRGAEGTIDEYDSYATSVLALLERPSPVEEIAAYLGSVESERMGLKPHRDKNEDVAVLLRELHTLLS